MHEGRVHATSAWVDLYKQGRVVSDNHGNQRENTIKYPFFNVNVLCDSWLLLPTIVRSLVQTLWTLFQLSHLYLYSI
jgi:hypothetical protein